ncbi:hypothetical protein [Zobellia roscoffensis]|uniref:hypothetical protein n=1 Tax=Zobellia roscoffensis TaxID=2779508 RepID=UPI00188ACB76|nr:hypothetical protein [Zobellia roscoffensis]
MSVKDKILNIVGATCFSLKKSIVFLGKKVRALLLSIISNYRKLPVDKRKSYNYGFFSLLLVIVASSGIFYLHGFFEEPKYYNENSHFFSAIEIEPTRFRDYRRRGYPIPYDSISEDRKREIEFWNEGHKSETKYDSLRRHMLMAKYSHNNLEDEIITIFSSYDILRDTIIYYASFYLDNDLGYKKQSEFKRKVNFYFSSPNIEKASLYEINEVDSFPYESKSKIAFNKIPSDSIKFYLFGYNPDVLPNFKSNDIFYYEAKIEIDSFPYHVEYYQPFKSGNDYYSNAEARLSSTISGQNLQSFLIENNVYYDESIEITKIKHEENIEEFDDLDNKISLYNIFNKNLHYNNDQIIPEELWELVGRNEIPTESSKTDVFVSFFDKQAKKEKDILIIILSIMVGTGFTGIFNTIFNFK